MQLIEMSAKKFVPKLEVLKLFQQEEIVTPMTLVDRFDLTYSGAVSRIHRLRKAGLVEPLGIERGRWVLTSKGYDHLDFLRRRRDDNR